MKNRINVSVEPKKIELGKILRELRIKASVSLSDVATKVGVADNIVNLVEIGNKQLPEAWIPILVDLFEVDQEVFIDRGPIRKCLLNLGKRLGYINTDDYYKLRIQDFTKETRILIKFKHFRRSIRKVLRFAFPEHDWLEWKFPEVSDGFWVTPDNVYKYIIWLGSCLQYENPMDPES